MNVQLWSYNYPPEPTGIAPVSETWAIELASRGLDIDVVAAHPHYPAPVWDCPRGRYRETRDGIAVTRLPLLVGRSSTQERLRQELSFAASLTGAIPTLPKPDVLVAVSPSFPALAPAMLNSRIRRVPLVVWLQDILPDGATSTGLISEGGPVTRAARALERRAYQAATRIVVVSTAFSDNLLGKGVPSSRMDLIFNPATRHPTGVRGAAPPQLRLLTMGNIGHSQGLDNLVADFEANADLNPDVTFVITGTGVAAQSVASRIVTQRVELKGVLDSEDLESELSRASVGVVSQAPDIAEFNIPSKLMNFMAYGIPVMAVVNPRSEVANIVRKSGAGWVVDPRNRAAFSEAVAAMRDSPAELAKRGLAGRLFSEQAFSRQAFGDRWVACLSSAVKTPAR